MKKAKIFICALVCMLATASAVAQTSVVAKQPFRKNAISTLIKERPGCYPATITCINNEGETVSFLFCNNNTGSQEAVIKNFYVNDMEVIKDTVFFCGKTFEEWPRGIIGFFNINDVFPGSGHIYIQDYFAYDMEHVAKEFTRMDIYVNSNYQRCIVCVGTCGEENNPCMVCMNPEPMGGYNMGFIDNNTETLYDVKYMESGENKHLVTAGFDINSGKYISLRVYDADDPFNPSGPQNIKYVFNDNNSGIRAWEGKEVLLQQIDDSIFSTVSYRRATPESDSTNCKIHFGIYGLSRMLHNSTYAMVDQHEISMSNSYNRKLDQYIKNKGHILVFLHTFTELATNDIYSEFCELYYPNIGYLSTIREYCHPDNLYQGMTIYNNNTKYAMSGFYRSSTDTLMYEMDTYGNNPTCANLYQNKYIQEEPITHMKINKEFLSVSGLDLIEEYQPGYDSLNLEIICP